MLNPIAFQGVHDHGWVLQAQDAYTLRWYDLGPGFSDLLTCVCFFFRAVKASMRGGFRVVGFDGVVMMGVSQ